MPRLPIYAFAVLGAVFVCALPTSAGAKLTGVTIGGGLIQDPNGDPNAAQKLRKGFESGAARTRTWNRRFWRPVP